MAGEAPREGTLAPRSAGRRELAEQTPGRGGSRERRGPALRPALSAQGQLARAGAGGQWGEVSGGEGGAGCEDHSGPVSRGFSRGNWEA